MLKDSTLTFMVVSDPDHGTLSGTAPNLIYTPDDDFNGTDGFSFTVNDGEDEFCACGGDHHRQSRSTMRH